MFRKLTTEEFIKKAKAVHSDRYDYSKVKYVNWCTKVVIVCPSHGEFEQAPNNHLRGKGCRKCCNERLSKAFRVSKDDFIKKAKEKHGDKYDYTEVEYTTASAKVKIRCKDHGVFLQSPNSHLSGAGCPKCGILTNKERITKTTQEFITQAHEIHGNKYNYSFVNYKTCKDKVEIVCNSCGNHFLQAPSDHLSGKGCRECGKLKCVRSRSKSHEEWVETLRKKNPHVEVLEKITNSRGKVLCRCRDCNYSWKVRPNTLQQGNGCPRCAKYGFLSHNRGKLYIMVDDLKVPTLMKVGVSVRVEKRKDKILRASKKTGFGIQDLHVVKTWSGSTQNMADLEKSVHKAFSKYKINFPVKFDGSTEFFYYRSEVFDMVEEVYKKICGK